MPNLQELSFRWCSVGYFSGKGSFQTKYAEFRQK